MRFCCTQFAWLLSITCPHIALSHYSYGGALGSKCHTWISAYFMCLHSHLPYFYVNLFELGKSRHKSFRNGNFLFFPLLYFFSTQTATQGLMTWPTPHLPFSLTYLLCRFSPGKGLTLLSPWHSSRTGTAAATNIIIQSHLLRSQLPVNLCRNFKCPPPLKIEKNSIIRDRFQDINLPY